MEDFDLNGMIEELADQAKQVAAQAVSVGSTTLKALADVDDDFFDSYATILSRAVSALEKAGFTREEAVEIAKGMSFK